MRCAMRSCADGSAVNLRATLAAALRPAPKRSNSESRNVISLWSASAGRSSRSIWATANTPTACCTGSDSRFLSPTPSALTSDAAVATNALTEFAGIARNVSRIISVERASFAMLMIARRRSSCALKLHRGARPELEQSISCDATRKCNCRCRDQNQRPRRGARFCGLRTYDDAAAPSCISHLSDRRRHLGRATRIDHLPDRSRHHARRDAPKSNSADRPFSAAALQRACRVWRCVGRCCEGEFVEPSFSSPFQSRGREGCERQ